MVSRLCCCCHYQDRHAARPACRRTMPCFCQPAKSARPANTARHAGEKTALAEQGSSHRSVFATDNALEVTEGIKGTTFHQSQRHGCHISCCAGACAGSAGARSKAFATAGPLPRRVGGEQAGYRHYLQRSNERVDITSVFAGGQSLTRWKSETSQQERPAARLPLRSLAYVLCTVMSHTKCQELL